MSQLKFSLKIWNNISIGDWAPLATPLVRTMLLEVIKNVQ